MPQITLTNKVQVVLFTQELCGQLSDGYWGNSNPTDHWKVPCKAKLVVGDEPHIDFRPLRKYNFNAQCLIDCVGDRMLLLCRKAIAYPNLSYDAMDVLDCGLWWWDQEINEVKYQRIHDDIVSELTGIGISGYDDIKPIVDLLGESSYKMKDMRKDLNGINAAFKNIKM